MQSEESQFNSTLISNPVANTDYAEKHMCLYTKTTKYKDEKYIRVQTRIDGLNRPLQP